MVAGIRGKQTLDAVYSMVTTQIFETPNHNYRFPYILIVRMIVRFVTLHM